jgi:hypothetical protein
MTGLANAVLVLLMTASPVDSRSDPCGTDGRLLGLANSYGVLVLCAACDVVPGADSVCNAVFGDKYWKTDFPSTLADRTSRVSVASGLDWVCSAVRSLPAASQYAVLDALESYVVVATTVEVMWYVVGEVAIGTAVAFVPAVADLIPREEKSRAALGRRIGESLASAELAQLEYDLASRLSQMPWEDKRQCLRALWIEALKQQEE